MGEPPVFSIDARLPNPAILTCNEDIPLRLVIKRLNHSPEPLFMRSLKITLIGYTRIIAQEIFRDETNIWMIANHMALHIPIEASKAALAGEEIVIDDSSWRQRALPTSVAPTFDICNISRKYELLVEVGIGYGNSAANVSGVLMCRFQS